MGKKQIRTREPLRLAETVCGWHNPPGARKCGEIPYALIRLMTSHYQWDINAQTKHAPPRLGASLRSRLRVSLRSLATPWLAASLRSSPPGLVAALGDLDEAQKVTVINNVKQSPELAKLIATIDGAQKSPLVLATAMTGPEKVAQQMSLDTKMKIVDIAANIAKITVALGVVDSENVRKALDVPLPL